MIRSYGVPVRSYSDAATAYKVAKAYFRTMRIRESHWLLVHLQLMRICSANFKGGDITIVIRSPFRAFVGLRRIVFLSREHRCCLDPGIFRSSGVVSQDYFHVE
jgi:hypothetical protein